MMVGSARARSTNSPVMRDSARNWRSASTRAALPARAMPTANGTRVASMIAAATQLASTARAAQISGATIAAVLIGAKRPTYPSATSTSSIAVRRSSPGKRPRRKPVGKRAPNSLLRRRCFTPFAARCPWLAAMAWANARTSPLIARARSSHAVWLVDLWFRPEPSHVARLAAKRAAPIVSALHHSAARRTPGVFAVKNSEAVIGINSDSMG